MRGLSGKSVIVTGGASGIGRETALRLCEEGCAVSIFALNAEGAEETARLGREKGSVAAGFRVDISDREAVAAALRECEALHGPTRSDERRVGEGCESKGRCRWSTT